MSLTADEIIKAEDRPDPVKVSVPEWGGVGHVYIDIMTGPESDSYQMREGADGKYHLDNSNACAELLVRCLCDKEGKRLFPCTPIAIQKLGSKSIIVLHRLRAVARKVNVLTEEAEEDLAKNSKAALSGSSGSD
jgi:hypothetical protein